MRAVVTVIFSSDQSLEIVVHPEDLPLMKSAQALQWFDQQWVELGCEPLRPSGKVLLLDKIMGVADALGYQSLQQPLLAQQFAVACTQAVQANTVKVDLLGLSVDF